MNTEMDMDVPERQRPGHGCPFPSASLPVSPSAISDMSFNCSPPLDLHGCTHISSGSGSPYSSDSLQSPALDVEELSPYYYVTR